ncbi:sortase B protein-sorting domain-containing protein [Clostridium baratii]
MKVGVRKKRNLKMLLSIMAFGCFSFIGATVANAETSGNVPVTYTKSESVAYPLNVEVIGDGEVSSGSDTLRNQKKNYLLDVDESMTFKLKADEGTKVKSVKLNGEDVMSKVKDNKITVEGEEKEQTLSIRFEEKKNGVMFPQTGDTTQIGLYIILLIMSLGAGGYMYYREKKNLQDK